MDNTKLLSIEVNTEIPIAGEYTVGESWVHECNMQLRLRRGYSWPRLPGLSASASVAAPLYGHSYDPNREASLPLVSRPQPRPNSLAVVSPYNVGSCYGSPAVRALTEVHHRAKMSKI